MTRTAPPPDKPPPPPPGATWPKAVRLLPGAPGPNQRWPGSGYSPGSGIAPPCKPNFPEPHEFDCWLDRVVVNCLLGIAGACASVAVIAFECWR